MAEWREETSSKGGRPSTYTRDVADAICLALADGESLKGICAASGMPPRSTVQGWIAEDVDGFGARYARARDIGLENMADEMLEIADDSSRDTIQGEHGPRPDAEWINRSRLRVDARKWLLSKRLPKVYGERLQLDATVTRGAEELTDDELAAIAAGGRGGASASPEGEG